VVFDDPVEISTNLVPNMVPFVILFDNIEPLKLPQGVSYKLKLYPEPVGVK
jgi:hypothetical protein